MLKIHSWNPERAEPLLYGQAGDAAFCTGAVRKGALT